MIHSHPAVQLFQIDWLLRSESSDDTTLLSFVFTFTPFTLSPPHRRSTATFASLLLRFHFHFHFSLDLPCPCPPQRHPRARLARPWRRHRLVALFPLTRFQLPLPSQALTNHLHLPQHPLPPLSPLQPMNPLLSPLPLRRRQPPHNRAPYRRLRWHLKLRPR